MTDHATALRLPLEEPDLGPWRRCSLSRLVEVLRAAASGRRAGSSRTGPLVVAVDGRSAAGKTTVASAVVSAVEGAVLVHTDDVAWQHAFFDWHELLVAGVLRPASAGREVAFRPPAWVERGRGGSVDVPAQSSLVLVEGVGASRRELTAWLDAAVWVQSDTVDSRTRGIARDITLGRETEEAQRFWDEWMSEEQPFLRHDRPWERADLAVLGTASTGPGQWLVSSQRPGIRLS